MPSDRVLLLQAATCVVLRRDLSLSRRLYTWILGPSEDSSMQMVYLKNNALSDLVQALEVGLKCPNSIY